MDLERKPSHHHPKEGRPIMNKEQIYDEQISPLMTDIIAVCKKHKIAFVASFAIPNDEDNDLRCTTALFESRDKSTEDVEDFRKACSILRGERQSPMMMTVDHGDGSKTVTSILG